MKRLCAVLVISTLFFGGVTTNASAQSIENCRISAARHSIVSLGFPVRQERLAFKANPKILVLPIQLKNEPKYTLTDQDRAYFDQAAVNITEFSQGTNKVNFVFNPTVELSYTASEFDDFKINVQKTFQNNFCDYSKLAQSANPVVCIKRQSLAIKLKLRLSQVITYLLVLK